MALIILDSSTVRRSGKVFFWINLPSFFYVVFIHLDFIQVDFNYVDKIYLDKI